MPYWMILNNIVNFASNVIILIFSESSQFKLQYKPLIFLFQLMDVEKNAANLMILILMRAFL